MKSGLAMETKLKALIYLLVLLLDTGIFVVALIALFIPISLLVVYKWALVKVAKFFFQIELIQFDGLFNGGVDIMCMGYDKDILVEDEDSRCPMAKLCQNAGGLISYEGPPLNVEYVRTFFWEKYLKDVLEANPDEVVKQAKYLNFCTYLVQVGGHIFRRRMDKASFDITSHIFEVGLPENQSVEQFCGELLAMPYKPQNPLWRVALLTKPATATEEGSQTQFECHIAIIFHHSIADGFSFLHVLEQLTGKQIICRFAPKVPISQRIRSVLKTPRVLITRGIMVMLPVRNITLRRPRDRSTRLTFGNIPLDKFTAIRRKTGSSVHTVLQTLLAAMLCKLHESRGAVLPKSLTSVVALPWPHHPYMSKMCNWMSCTLIPLPLKNTKTNDRLVDIHRSLQEDLISGFDTTGVPATAYFLSLIPFTRWDKMNSPFQAIWSPMCADDPLEVFNLRRVTNLRNMGGRFALGVYITILSITYNGQVNYTITGSNQLYSEQQLEQLKVWMNEELENLLKVEIKLKT